jgi:hypothetical protein
MQQDLSDPGRTLLPGYVQTLASSYQHRAMRHFSPSHNIPSLFDNHEANTRSSFHSSFLELLLLDIRPLDG